MPDGSFPDALILAALARAECHRGYQGAPDWTILEHLAIRTRSKSAREVKARLPKLVEAGLLAPSRRHSIAQYTVTPKGRKHLSQASTGTTSLPESPQHRRWRDARDLADHEIEGFYLGLRDCVDTAADLLSAPIPPGSPSDAWFAIGERLHKACRRLGSATYCLHEWREPSEDQADSDDCTDPSDARYPDDERKRRKARRSGRRNTRLWDYDDGWLG
jgi:hypothetical protein